MTEATQRTSDSGVSIWLDDLSRSRIESGSLQDLIANKNVVGVTTNPSIFQKALHEVGPYDPQLKELGKVDVETCASSPPPTCATPPTSSVRSPRSPISLTAASPSRWIRVWLTRPRPPRSRPSRLWAKVNRPNAMIQDSGHPRRPAGNHRHPRASPSTSPDLPRWSATGRSSTPTSRASPPRLPPAATTSKHRLRRLASSSRVDTAVDKLLGSQRPDEAT